MAPAWAAVAAAGCSRDGMDNGNGQSMRPALPLAGSADGNALYFSAAPTPAVSAAASASFEYGFGMPPANNYGGPVSGPPSQSFTHPSSALTSAGASASSRLGTVDFKTDVVVKAVCFALEQLVARNEQAKGCYSEQRLDLLTFADKILRSGLCAKECFVLVHIYGQRLVKKQAAHVVTSQTVHRLFLVCLMVASKFLDDFYCRNMYFALLGGMTNAVLNDLELRLCFMLEFDLSVTKAQFEAAVSALTYDGFVQPSPVSWHLPVKLPPTRKSYARAVSTTPSPVPLVAAAPAVPSHYLCAPYSRREDYVPAYTVPVRYIPEAYAPAAVAAAAAAAAAAPYMFAAATAAAGYAPTAATASATTSTLPTYVSTASSAFYPAFAPAPFFSAPQAVPAAHATVSLPWDTQNIWAPPTAPGPHPSPCASVFRSDPLGVASAWYSRPPQCPPA